MASSMRSHGDPLHDVPRDLPPPPVVEPRGSRVGGPGQVLHVLQGHGLVQIVPDGGGLCKGFRLPVGVASTRPPG
jgi:hypothetical protein